MQGTNLDAAYAMAETEVSLINSYWKTCRIALPTGGQTHYDAVAAIMDSELGNRWSSEHKVCFYNFAKVVGEQQLSLISDAYHSWVNPSEFFC